MPKIKKLSEAEVLNLLRILPESKKKEALDFLELLSRRTKKEQKLSTRKAASAVEKTWGSISLDKKSLQYIAEDKELEYEV
ncbi:MAG: hypothetical protein AB1805_16140 [Nitrospirota bacterium]